MRGGIQHRPDRPSPWKARYRGPDGIERSKSHRTKEAAERWLRHQLAGIDRGEWVNPKDGERAFGDLASEWFDGLTVKPKTADSYRSLLDSRVVPRFGSMPIGKIRPADVRHWVAGLADEGLSASRIRQARHVLKAVLEVAVLDGALVRNPAAGVRLPTARPSQHRYLTAGQVSELAGAAESIRAGAGLVVRTLSYGGLRWGELVALRRSRVEVLRRRITVAESATEIGGRLEWGTPKSHRTRAVVVPRFLADELAIHLADVEPDGLVFTAPGGGPLRVGNFRRSVWLPAVAACGLAGLRVHDLRNTCASLAISAGASVLAVSRMLGHANPSVTLNTYAGLFDEDLEGVADRLHEAFAAQMRPKPHRDVVGISH